MPIPEITRWSVITFFRRAVVPANMSASPSAVRDSASGPRDAICGTAAGSLTTHTANRFWVPASVRSNPGASPGVPRCTRSAMGPFPGLRGAAASLSDQRNQPARDRWVTRCRSPACSPRYLPQRVAPVTVWPCKAVIGGSKVLSTDRADISMRPMVAPVAWRRR
ncbi:Uncharacterised protein [Mycobacteroides abscessus subsp. abscessus]|nr:Uncharacterised protein [Mycobacteroides abscessus subsp. abscessus]